MKKYVLITGASAGLGKAMAIELARQGHNLILVSLPNENLAELAQQIRISCNVKVAFYETDLCTRPNIEALVTWLRASKFEIFYLINNAGIGGSQAFELADTERIERIIQLNIVGTALLTRLVLPFLLKFSQSYILNVSSMAAFTPIPYKTVYPASKAFIYSFSLGLRAELSALGVQVSVVHPGPMPHSPENQARLQKHGRLGRMLTVPLQVIAQIALEQVQRGQSVIIPGWTNKFGYWVSRWVPWSWRRPLMVSMLRKELSPSV
ncbi:SDR family NAD(P)-dependent oxidoreductase [Larkinella terrae]|uniref:NADP-dependent 3-hydroxy acid dehydrogenase YdfG n=1 Tax=Larkinella terrae TaxID=2025311 RepID=A0A7K0EPY6_9BACT|nr:SDR family NAD(P)-dependent oxidoreductase [Larkinella terrae]MRS63857.1 SDR family NAD(P)-dependent oxidoreductase [Larkinella terrae]